MENLKQVPTAEDAEQALVSAILTNNKAVEKVYEFLRPEHFSNESLGRIYGAALKLIMEQSRLADPITLKDYFASNGLLDEIGGVEILAKLAGAGVTLINAEDYGQQIYDRHLRRELISIANDIANDAYAISLDETARDQVAIAETKIANLADKDVGEQGLMHFQGALNEALVAVENAMKNPDGISGTATGFTKFDEQTGGLNNSDLIILAGRPAMGKTALATTMAYNVAKKFREENMNPENKQKKSVALFSLEMSASQLAARILSTQTHINSHHMRTGKLSDANFMVLASAISDLSNMPLYVDDTPGLTVHALKTRAKKLKRDKNKGLGLIVVDYLQLISPSGVKGVENNRVQILSEITRQLKIIAKELNVPVIALSQLSRQVESREDKRPMLSDLRESGSIEQDADIVLFVYRDIYYLERTKIEQRATENDEKFQSRLKKHEDALINERNRAEIIIAKQRHGPTGTVPVYFNGEFAEFGNLQE